MENSNVLLEEKIKNLELRVERLEDKERRKQVTGIIKIILAIVLIIAMTVVAVILYKKIYQIINPYKETIQNSDLNSILEEYEKYVE